LTSLGNHLRKEDTLPDLAMADTVTSKEKGATAKKKKKKKKKQKKQK
jgi:hypothetical protein